MFQCCVCAVSYTHLDVYKRQATEMAKKAGHLRESAKRRREDEWDPVDPNYAAGSH